MNSHIHYTAKFQKSSKLPQNFENIFEPLIYHDNADKKKRAYIHFFSKNKVFTYLDKKTNEEKTASTSNSSLSKLKATLTDLKDVVDVYATVNQFSFTRKLENLLYTTMLYSDLDIYHTEFKDISKEDFIEKVLKYCFENKIPEPNLIIYSGNGFYLKWIFSAKCNKYEFTLDKYKIAQKAIHQLFSFLGADSKALDASRVLRLPGSINSKTGRKCEVIYYNDERKSAQDLFESFSKFYTPEPSKPLISKIKKVVADETEKQEKPAKQRFLLVKRDSSKAPIKTLNSLHLAKARYDDLKKLIEIRNNNVENSRMTFLFWLLNFKALCGSTNFVDFENDAYEISEKLNFKKTEWSFDELSTLEKKLFKHNNKYKKVVKQDDEYFKLSNLYTPKNQTLIDIFQITDEEQKELKTIISASEKNSRRAQKRLDAGMKPQSNSEAKTQPWKNLGIGKTKYYELKKMGKL
ncbi:hypothetical protein [Pseudomonas juntendi]|uniref:hypothetical protein n=1 Tax=Pseudomonas juntendi TaxID=2666183 RepID=UPI001B837A39|nr:hypothetical protein [Pseudomonas juntendi]MBR7523934.1 hypothetical protein [Pseudomonas juntendi]